MAVPQTVNRLFQDRERLASTATGDNYKSSQTMILFVFIVFLFLPVFVLAIPRLHKLRPAAFAVTVSLGVTLMHTLRGRFFGQGNAVGLLISTTIIRMGVMLVLRSPVQEFLRLERTQCSVHNREALQLDNGETIYWQAYPSTLFHRLHWVMDLCLTRRGHSWNWSVGHKHLLPKQLQSALLNPSQHSGRVSSRATKVESISIVWVIVKHYSILDLTTFAMKQDPYFWGLPDLPPFPLSPSNLFGRWPLALRLFRVLLGFNGLLNFLSMLHAAVKLLARMADSVAKSFGICLPSQEQAKICTPLFGPPHAIFEYGLAGFWGGFWHQLYRFDGQSCSEAVLSCCSTWAYQNAQIRRTITMVTIFFMVGLTHACGSYTQIGASRPLRGPLLFFMLQPVGISIQKLLLATVTPPVRHIWPRQMLNIAYTTLWFLITGPLIADDYFSGAVGVNDVPSLLATLFPIHGFDVKSMDFRAD